MTAFEMASTAATKALRVTPLLLGMGLLTACPPSDTGITDVDDPVRVLAQFEVTPALLTFGPVERDSFEAQQFTVSNVGDTQIEVRSLGIVGAEAFSLTDADVPLVLQPEETHAFTVRYDAANLLDQGVVTVTVDAGGEGAKTVDLVGETLIPVLEVGPVDLGTTSLTCPPLEEPLVIRNVGSAPATVDQILLASAPAGFVTEPVTPLTVQPGAFVQLPISMSTDIVAAAGGQAFVTADDPGSPHEVDVTGVVNAGQDEVVDLFEQPEDPGMIDILFTIDQSCSMEENIQELTTALDSMVTELATFEADWQAAVVPFFHGCHAGQYFTADTPNLNTEFAAAAFQLGQAGADDTERGLEMARDAVVDTTNCNAGMLRPDAKLAVIMVSDERDQSAPYDISDPENFDHWATYVTEVNAVVPGTTFHGIVGAPDLPLWDFNEQGDTCAERGEGYYQAVNATGGLLLDVCDTEWSGHTEALGEAIGEAATGIRWTLTHDPVEDTITVTVDGVEVTNWVFDPNTGDIVFDEAPAPGAQIEVTYTDAASCGN